jgi:hypothetical protein
MTTRRLQRPGVKEYIVDGYSGEYLDRPALEELRKDPKTDTFDATISCAPTASRAKSSIRTSLSAI